MRMVELLRIKKLSPPLSHSIFHHQALKAAKKLKYKPLTYQGEPVAYPNMKHKFTFILEGESIDLDSAANSFNKINRLLKAKKYTEAEKLASENLEKDPFFYYQLALAQNQSSKKYEEAANSALDFLISRMQRLKPSRILLPFSCSTLFMLNLYIKIISLRN